MDDDEESSFAYDLSDTSNIESHIRAGQLALRAIRCRVSGSLLALGILSGVLVLALSWVMRMQREDRNRGALGHLLEVATCASIFSRIFFLSLAPLADDICLTRTVLALDVLLLLASYGTVYFNRGGFSLTCLQGCPSCREQQAFEFCLGVNTMTFACTACLAMCRTTSVRVQVAMWNSIALWLAVKTLLNVVQASSELLVCGRFSKSWWWALFCQATFIIVWKPRLRYALQERLRRIFNVKTAQASAAGIAGLVGNCSVEEALAEAKARFRCISLDELSQQDIEENRPNPRLFTLSMPAKLGHDCDAFVSHSWHDDAVAKWAALQSWRSKFKLRESREPRVWIDKCCINQNSIEADLRSLPVFLSGCSRLVMLCGTTYLSRLWCVVEVFAYVHVGGKVREIDFMPVLRHNREEEDLDELRAAFELFDAQECSCSLWQDKEKLLGIIHAAFGSMEHFNKAVRAIMSTARLQCGPAYRSQSSSSSGELSSSSEEEVLDSD